MYILALVLGRTHFYFQSIVYWDESLYFFLFSTGIWLWGKKTFRLLIDME